MGNSLCLREQCGAAGCCPALRDRGQEGGMFRLGAGCCRELGRGSVQGRLPRPPQELVPQSTWHPALLPCCVWCVRPALPNGPRGPLGAHTQEGPAGCGCCVNSNLTRSSEWSPWEPKGTALPRPDPPVPTAPQPGLLLGGTCDLRKGSCS